MPSRRLGRPRPFLPASLEAGEAWESVVTRDVHNERCYYFRR